MKQKPILSYLGLKTKGNILSTGLWSYSRHPNYFFDWLVWFGVGVMGISLPWGLMSFIGCFLMWFIFNYLTGPITERLSLKSMEIFLETIKKKSPSFFPRLKKK